VPEITQTSPPGPKEDNKKYSFPASGPDHSGHYACFLFSQINDFPEETCQRED